MLHMLCHRVAFRSQKTQRFTQAYRRPRGNQTTFPELPGQY